MDRCFSFSKANRWISARSNVIAICTACEEQPEDHIKGLYGKHDQWHIKAPTTETVYGYLREIYFCLPEQYQILALPEIAREAAMTSNVPRPEIPSAGVPDSILSIKGISNEGELNSDVQSPVASDSSVASEVVLSLEVPNPDVPVSQKLTLRTSLEDSTPAQFERG